MMILSIVVDKESKIDTFWKFLLDFCEKGNFDKLKLN